MNLPYTDGLLEARESNHPGWVSIVWLYPGKEPMKTYRTFRKLDKAVKDQGFKGWVMASEVDHKNMHRHIIRAGGFPYFMNERHIFFKKEVN